MSLLEATAAIAIASLAVIAALAAALTGARVAGRPVARDLAFVAARNAAVEVRAASAYDAAAAAVILAAPETTWSANGIALTSTVDGSTLVITATSGGERVRLRAPVVQEALPQGAIVDAPLR